jgi:hypothetical protein
MVRVPPALLVLVLLPVPAAWDEHALAPAASRAAAHTQAATDLKFGRFVMWFSYSVPVPRPVPRPGGKADPGQARRG